jgi:hypothetical protein
MEGAGHAMAIADTARDAGHRLHPHRCGHGAMSGRHAAPRADTSLQPTMDALLACTCLACLLVAFVAFVVMLAVVM